MFIFVFIFIPGGKPQVKRLRQSAVPSIFPWKEAVHQTDERAIRLQNRTKAAETQRFGPQSQSPVSATAMEADLIEVCK